MDNISITLPVCSGADKATSASVPDRHHLTILPEEVLIRIMKKVDSLHSLWSVIISCKKLHSLFLGQAEEIVDSVLASGNTTTETINHMRAAVYVRFGRVPNITNPLAFLSGTNVMPDLPRFSDNQVQVKVTPPVLRSLVCLSYRIHRLAHFCLERSLGKCKYMLSHPWDEESRLLDQIPPAVVRRFPREGWFRRTFTWSDVVEDITILSIWRLHYFYQLKIALAKPWTEQDSLPSDFREPSNPIKTDLLTTYFHSHVREQVLSVVTLLDELEGLQRVQTAYTLDPESKYAKKRALLEEYNRLLNVTDEDNFAEALEFEWSRTAGPFRLPELRSVNSLQPEDFEWQSRCAFTGRPAPPPSHSSFATTKPDTDQWYLPRSADKTKDPAYMFLKTINRPDMTDYGNTAVEKLPIKHFREFGVFLFDSKLLAELRMWPCYGLRASHVHRLPMEVNRIDKYLWLWMKFLPTELLQKYIDDDKEQARLDITREKTEAMATAFDDWNSLRHDFPDSPFRWRMRKESRREKRRAKERRGRSRERRGRARERRAPDWERRERQRKRREQGREKEWARKREEREKEKEREKERRKREELERVNREKEAKEIELDQELARAWKEFGYDTLIGEWSSRYV